MNDTPFRSGGLAFSSTCGVGIPGDEPVLRSDQVGEWLSSRGFSEDWLREHGIRTTGDSQGETASG